MIHYSILPTSGNPKSRLLLLDPSKLSITHLLHGGALVTCSSTFNRFTCSKYNRNQWTNILMPRSVGKLN